MTKIALVQYTRPVSYFITMKKEGYLHLSPSYQRGEVWGVIRKRNLIKSLMTGIPIPSIIVNERFAAGWKDWRVAVIDGKQRICAILDFLEDRLAVPGEWFGMDKDLVKFSEISQVLQRSFKSATIQVAEGRLETEDAEKEVFEIVNFGGVPQGQTDIPE